MFRKIAVLSLICTGCASPLGEREVKAGTVGVIAERTKTKIVEVFTPKYPLYKAPISLCGVPEGQENNEAKPIKCIVAPCSEGKECTIEYASFNEFLVDNPKWSLLSVTAKAVANASEFCERNIKSCIEQVGHFAGSTVVITNK